MKTGRNLESLMTELKRQQASKVDLIAMIRDLSLITPGGVVELNMPGHGSFPLRPLAHRQIAAHTNIPQRYYDRMLADDSSLLLTNVNHWFGKDGGRRMIRTLDNEVRAVLSDRYQRIEHLEIANVVLPVLAEYPDLRIESCEVTDARLYIKAVNPRVTGEVRKGDVVQAGVCIANSETGLGALSVKPLVFTLACLNGMIIEDQTYQRRHVGARADERDEAVYAMLSDETKAADDKAILLKVRDVVRASLDEARFAATLDRMKAAAEGQTIDPRDVNAAVEVLASKIDLSAIEARGILGHLFSGGSLSQWGVVSAITRFAQDVESYDRSTELEALGGKVLDFTQKEWREVAEATA